MPSKGQVLKRVLNYIRKYWHLVLVSLVLATITVALTLYVPILIGQGIDCIAGREDVNFLRLKEVLWRLALVACFTAVSQWLMNHFNNVVTYRVVKDIRNKAFEHLEVMPFGYLDTHPTGDLVSRMITDIDQFSEGLLMGFTQLFTGVLTILGTLMFMLRINPLITVVVVLITPVSFVVAAFIARRTFAMFGRQSASRGELTALIDELLGNLKVVQAFSRQEQARADFAKINQQLAAHSLSATFFSSLTNPATRFVNGLVYAGVGAAGAYGVIRGHLSVGRLTSFLSYANQYTKPFNEISGVITELQNALVSAGRVFDFIDQPVTLTDRPDAVRLDAAAGRIDFEQVSFSYQPQVKLIEQFNLSVAPGQKIAIVGPTGSGKSTLINLLMRFYDVDSGTIRVDGQDIRKVTRESLRANFGMVLQETWLKSGTIKENISYGHPEAEMAEIVRAAEMAHAHSFIKKMPEGYDTYISEDGGSLSQGQKQLLCIARVMLRLPPMLILDEATSSIDTRTELMVQKAFNRMMEGRTSFIVAHRLSTIKEADVILVLNQGSIVEQGTHDELLKQNGFYANLYESQFAGTK